MHALAAALFCLAAQPGDPTPLPHEPMQGRVQVDGSSVPVELLCEQGDDIVYLEKTPPALGQIRRQGGAKVASVRLNAAPTVVDPPSDCGMGTCYFQQAVQSADGRTLQLTGRRSLYYGSWTPSIVLREQGPGPGFKAICPGERPLAVCFTARRTVQIVVAGDRNDEPVRYTVDYLATPPGAETRETLHLSHGAVRTQRERYEIAFTNQGYTYRLSAAKAGAAPGATLTVERSGRTVQTEPCVAYGLWPMHLDWAEQLNR